MLKILVHSEELERIPIRLIYSVIINESEQTAPHQELAFVNLYFLFCIIIELSFPEKMVSWGTNSSFIFFLISLLSLLLM